jgi:hypothetical protein
MCAQSFPHQQQQQEEDVVYLKDGGVLRGEIIGKTAKTGRIQLRDGSVFVYQKSNIKMIAKELLMVSEQSAKMDSLKVVSIAKKIVAEESEIQRIEEDMRAFQNLLNDNSEVKHVDDEPEGIRLYSVLDVSLGIGFGDLPTPQGKSSLSATNNNDRFVDVRYVVGGRGRCFGMGVSLGIQQLYRAINPSAQPDSSGSARVEQGSAPPNLPFLPLGLDMRMEFMPGSAASLFVSANAAYAISLSASNSKNGYFVASPAVGLRFGRTMSSLLSAGFQFNVDKNGDVTNFFALRFGLVF